MRRPKVCVLLPVHWSAGMGGAEYQARLLVEHWVTRYDADLVSSRKNESGSTSISRAPPS